VKPAFGRTDAHREAMYTEALTLYDEAQALSNALDRIVDQHNLNLTVQHSEVDLVVRVVDHQITALNDVSSAITELENLMEAIS
jgi:glutamate-1-semialdehyde aminotransferase